MTSKDNLDQMTIDKEISKKDSNPNLRKREFLLGFANSMYQASGELCGETNWSTAADNGSVVPVSLGQAISHWHNFEDDLDKMQEMGVNSYRFSIEWGHIEPEKGKYDEAVLKRYDEMIVACLERNIKPMLTLFHFNEPYWFTRLHGFEKEVNIKYFLSFAEMIFRRYSKYVKLWCTFNEPSAQAFSGYFYGQFPPHKHSIKKTINYQLNLFKAHVIVYKKLKLLAGGKDAEIGIVHNVIRFIPRYAWEPFSNLISRMLTKITDDLFIQFFKTGQFDYKLKGIFKKSYSDPTAPNTFDFIGLNFYGNVVLGFNRKNFFGPTHFPGQTMGHFYLPIDPAGFDAALAEVATLGKPIYVTETGHATDNDDARAKCLDEYLAVLENKLAEDMDVRGFYVWTFADNYEWDQGHSIKFGLHDQYRVERGSAKVYKKHIKRLLNDTKRELK